MDVLRTKCKAIKIIHGNYRLSIFFGPRLSPAAGHHRFALTMGRSAKRSPCSAVMLAQYGQPPPLLSAANRLLVDGTDAGFAVEDHEIVLECRHSFGDSHRCGPARWSGAE
jgi:hypothetical protein